MKVWLGAVMNWQLVGLQALHTNAVAACPVCVSSSIDVSAMPMAVSNSINLCASLNAGRMAGRRRGKCTAITLHLGTAMISCFDELS
jgi:hypothetical protein